MKFIVNSKQMKQIDKYTIEKIGIPGIVLMEQAALFVNQAVIRISGRDDRILIVCGVGNNGADGIAVSRLLKLEGYLVDVLLVGDINKATSLFLQQLDIAKNLSISIYNKLELDEYTIIVDAIFGVGLNRNLDKDYIDLINKINAAKKKIVSVDIPSGLSADIGKSMGAVINAYITVTFGYLKMGLVLYPGCEVAGSIEVANTLFPKIALKKSGHSGYIYEKQDLSFLPTRENNSNKGTFGKVLVIAGSENVYGACYFSAKAAYRIGAGLVKVVSPACNKATISANLPEALIYAYDSGTKEENLLDDIRMMLEWASVIVMGPGMGFSDTSKAIFDYVIQNTLKPLILDADALQMLSILADDKHKDSYLNHEDIIERIEFYNQVLPNQTILTPHMKELADLLRIPVKEVKDNVLAVADSCTNSNDLIYVMKDARTIVAQHTNRYINASGNNGMATGGSGDVLTGIIAGLIAQGLTSNKASELGVYIHGLAGDAAKEKYGEYSLMASDIIDMISYVIKK